MPSRNPNISNRTRIRVERERERGEPRSMIGATESIETPTTPEETNQTRRAHHRDWRNNESVGMAREIYIGEAKFVDGSDLVKVRSAVATWHARTGRTELYWAKSR